MKRILLCLMIAMFLISCNENKTTDVMKVTVHDWYKNSNKSIDSLKNLSIKEGLKGNLDSLKFLCELVAQLDSNDADNFSRLSMVYLILGDYNKGLKAINRSMFLDTNVHLSHNYTFKACLFYELKNNDSSRFYFNKMLLIDQQNAMNLNEVVSFFYRFKNEIKGKEYINLTFKYYPHDETAVLNKALISAEKDNYTEPIKLLNTIKNTSKNPNIFYNLSICYSNSKQYQKALNEINRAIELDHGTNSSYFIERGRTKQDLKDFKGAEKDFNTAIEKGDTSAIRFYKSLKEQNHQ